MKAAINLVAVLLLSVGLAFAQDHPTVTAQPNTVFVAADGKFEANPDTAVVQFNISAQQDNSRAAYDQASKQAPMALSPQRRNSAISPLNPFTTTSRRNAN